MGDHLVFYDIQEVVNRKADPAIGGMCDGRFPRMENSDVVEMIEKHPGHITFCVLIIAALLLLPQLASSTLNVKTHIKNLCPNTSFLLVREKSKETENREKENLEQEVSFLRMEVQRMSQKFGGA